VHNDLRLGVAKTNTILDLKVLGQHLASVEFDQIVELAVDDRELVGDELLKHKGIFVLVDVVQSVHIGTQCSAQLPAICLFHAEETFVIRMQIL
jgi:hypothetical protein